MISFCSLLYLTRSVGSMRSRGPRQKRGSTIYAPTVLYWNGIVAKFLRGWTWAYNSRRKSQEFPCPSGRRPDVVENNASNRSLQATTAQKYLLGIDAGVHPTGPARRLLSFLSSMCCCSTAYSSPRLTIARLSCVPSCCLVPFHRLHSLRHSLLPTIIWIYRDFI